MTTEPQTAAGRALLASLHAQAPVHVPIEQDAASILAIEREARSGLDSGLRGTVRDVVGRMERGELSGRNAMLTLRAALSREETI